jgi:5-methylcytosine-specific restriction endonuclease McrA
MGQSRRARVLARFNGMCAYPGCEISDSLQIDHTIPIALGGVEEDHNLRPLCNYHHLQKTKLDVKMIAKAKRIIKRDAGEGRVKRKIPSRGFSKPTTPIKIQSRGFGPTKKARRSMEESQ